MQIKKTIQLAVISSLCAVPFFPAQAQQLMETGGKKMPDEWIDKDTHHKVVRLTRKEGQNASFYFHNNPFVENKMVFYSTDKKGKQIWTVGLNDFKLQQVTQQALPMNGEIVGRKTHNVYYQIKDSVFATNVDTKKTKLIFVFPKDFKASVTTLNADETLLGGVWSSDEEKEIFRQHPEKSDYFNRIYEAHLPRTLFVVDTRTKELKKLYSDTSWLNHVQFSPADPNILMFCHEGPWHKVDRIWAIDVQSKAIKLMHKRSMNMEIAGHEFFAPDGKTIWFDNQVPRSENFYLTGANIKTGAEKRYQMTRDEWSIHFNISPDQKLFCGDGGNDTQVAKAKNGMWIYLFTPTGDHFTSEKLVNMKHHGYKLEPNVHFSPDGKWIIFRANFEGVEESYAVEIKKSK